MCSIPGSGRSPWRRQWHPTPVLLPGKFRGWRRLVGYSPWGRKESDMTERLPFHFPGEGNGTPLRYSCLENPMDRGVWRATVHEFAKSRRWLRHRSLSKPTSLSPGGVGAPPLSPRCLSLNVSVTPATLHGYPLLLTPRKLSWGGPGPFPVVSPESCRPNAQGGWRNTGFPSPSCRQHLHPYFWFHRRDSVSINSEQLGAEGAPKCASFLLKVMTLWAAQGLDDRPLQDACPWIWSFRTRKKSQPSTALTRREVYFRCNWGWHVDSWAW